MAKIVKYDKDGNEVLFDHAIDARQAVESGQFFNSPKAEEPKAEEPEVQKGKKGKKEKDSENEKDSEE